MKFILGRKVGMTRMFDDEGRNFAVTRISTLPCKITQIKNDEHDGYKSVQISAKNRLSSGKKAKKIIKIAEFLETNVKRYKVGEDVVSDQFKKNEKVTVEGTGKGKGFSGTVKRHGFTKGPVSHGSKNVRKPGSIGGSYPQRVVPGKKMPGRMGGKNVTVRNLRIIDVDNEMILIAGAIPGPTKSIVKIFGKGEKAEETIDAAAEEEKRAQEKMLEEQKVEKEENKEEVGKEKKTEESKQEENKEEVGKEKKTEESKQEKSKEERE